MARGTALHEKLRYRPGFLDRGERFDKAQAILTEVLEKHGRGHDNVTAKNFHEVMKHARKHPDWDSLYSGGVELENAIRKHLKIEEPEEHHASITPSPSPSSETSEPPISAKKEEGSET